MVDRKKENKIKLTIVLLIILYIIVFFYYFQEHKSRKKLEYYLGNQELLKFNYDSGIYDDTINIEISKADELFLSAKIYYTLNGDDPTFGSTLYNGKIVLDYKKEDINVYPLKAIVYYNGKISQIYEKTYIIGEKIFETLDLPIISITSDSYGLYNYETGILVPGKTYDENIVKGINIGNYNNRGPEWIRNANIAMFNNDGTKILEQDIGLSVAGKRSAQRPIKSFEIKADYEYDLEHNKFQIDFFADDLFSKESILYKYKKLRLRSGAQDVNLGNIRSAVVSRLANEAGFVTTGTQRSIVYLNGDFYGIFDIQEEYSDSYFMNRFNLNETGFIETYKETEGQAFKESNILKYFSKDLNIEENRIELEKRVDMDSYLSYYAINILINNQDWPQNNFMIWKYNGEYDSTNKYSDGRYRFMIYDTDITYYSTYWSTSYIGDTFVDLMEQDNRATNTTFKNVMNSEYYRNKLVTIILDYLNDTFSTENVLKTVEEERNIIYKMSKILLKEDEHRIKQEAIEYMKNAIKLKENNVTNNLEKYFNYSDMYELNITVNEGVKILKDNIEIYSGQKYKNKYYKGINIILNSELYPGYKDVKYRVNGIEYNAETISITDEMIKNGKIEVEVEAFKDDKTELIIYEVAAKSDCDWMKFYNLSEYDIETNNYYISDDYNNFKKYQLPKTTLKPKETITINCKNNYYSLGDYICNFNLDDTDTLYLYDDQKKEIVFFLEIPNMNEYESYGRYLNSNTFVYYNNVNNKRK